MTHAALAARPLRFALDGREVFLELDRGDGLDLLEWLGLGRGEFGAIEASALWRLCVARLWASDVESRATTRSIAPMRRRVWRILRTLRHAQDAIVHFG
jgi:hypothetical protein